MTLAAVFKPSFGGNSEGIKSLPKEPPGNQTLLSKVITISRVLLLFGAAGCPLFWALAHAPEPDDAAD